MKKKLFLILLISIFSITLIGCGKNTTDNNTNNAANNNENTDSGYISEVKAKDIALSNAGFKENEVSELSVELDDDDDNNKTIYEIGFKHGQQEYDYDIDATNGKILNKSVEIDD